ncbi:MAG TPA: hypothetical protein VG538_02525 [Vicinamibacterales bacterium]|nr:hypothetical protein [Vicinamibacterales bacterium]
MARRPVGEPAARPRPARGSQTLSSAETGISSAPFRIPAAPPPAPSAMFLFERGMQALQRHDYQGASRQFTVIVDEFPIADGLADRARVYLDLCNRELRHRPDVRPQTIEEQLTAATAALNDDEDERAEELARSVLNVAPDHDLALYIMASVQARRGSLEAALDFLRRAIAASPDVGAQVRHDEDFECLRSSMDFQMLIEEAVARPQDQPKTYRKSRSER